MVRYNSTDARDADDGELWLDILSNKVVAIGSSSEVSCFQNLCVTKDFKDKQTKFRFDRIIPIPPDIEDEHEWCLDEWGCSTIPTDVVVEQESDAWSLTLTFSSFGNFPEMVFYALSKKFNKLSFYCSSEELFGSYKDEGWFNGPQGCASFDNYDSAYKNRNAMDELRHQFAIAHLRRQAQEEDGWIT